MQSHHLLQTGIVFVFCGILLWLLFRESKVRKLYLNIDGDLISHFYGGSDCVAGKLYRIKIVGIPAEVFNINWNCFLMAVERAGQFPVSLDFLGRKITIVVDRNKDEVAEDSLTRDNVLGLQLNRTGDLGFGEFRVKLMSLTHERDLESTIALHHKGSQQSSGHAHRKPKCVIQHGFVL